MNNITEMIERIQSNSSRTAKEELLRQATNILGFQDVMQYLFNPYIKTNIGAKKLEAAKHDHTLGKYTTYGDIINHFGTDASTGTAYDAHIAWTYINSVEPRHREIAKGLVTKDIKMGVTDKTLNKVYGQDFIPRTGCMLADKYRDCKNKVAGPFLATEKLDGARRILIIDANRNVKVYTRSGHLDEGLNFITDFARIHLPANRMYDGELLATGTFADSIAQRQATNSIASRKGQKHGLTLHIFDTVPLPQYLADNCNETALARKKTLETIFENVPTNETINMVPVIGRVSTEAEVMALAISFFDRKLEGIMLNKANGLYRIKRSKDLLKVKATESLDLPIAGFQEGTGKYTGTLGAVFVEYKGYRVGVGSGFTDAERDYIWNNRGSLVGTKIEIDYFGESTNQNGGVSLNCPIFRGVRYDK